MVTPGRLGDLTKGFYVYERTGLDWPRSLSSALVDRLLDIIFMGLAAIWAIFYLDFSNRIIDTNVNGVQNTVIPFIPQLLEQYNGHIAIVGSIASYIAWPGMGAYSASKFAVRALSESYRRSLPREISVTLICPGYVTSEMTDKVEWKPFLISTEKAAKKKKKGKVKSNPFSESKIKRYTVKEVRMWMKKLEENRYKKVYNSDARRVAWMVNNEGVELSEMPKSMSKKWTKAQYGRERYLATEFLKSKSEQLSETKFYAFFNKKKHTIDGKSLYDAKQKAILKLKVPKSKVGMLSIVNAKEHDRGGFRFEQKLREQIREIIKEQLNEAYRSQSIFFDKKDKSKLEKLLKKNKGKFPFNPSGESVVNWSLNDRGSKGLEWSGIPKAKYNKAVEFFMKNKLNPRG